MKNKCTEPPSCLVACFDFNPGWPPRSSPRPIQQSSGDDHHGQAPCRGFLKLVSDAKSRVKECTVQDVRSPGGRRVASRSWSARGERVCRGSSTGALHIGKGVIERDIEAKVPDAASPLVLYCGGGFRSRPRRPKRAEDGLHQRHQYGWRLDRLGEGRLIRPK